jgi:hypothetical protein
MSPEYKDSAGLEVVPGDGLVVADHHAGAGLEPMWVSNNFNKYTPDEPLQSPADCTLEKAVTHRNPSSDVLRRRRRACLCLLGAIVLCLVVLAAILGGVLGSRARSTPTASDHNTAAPDHNTAASDHNTTRGLLANTDIAAVAWASDAVHYRVFYQDPSLQIRMSSWDNIHMVRSYQSSFWG